MSRGILVPSVDLAQNARRPLRQWADWFADFLAQLLRVSLLKKGLQGHPGSPPTYLALGHLYFESVDAFVQAWGPQAQEIVSDVPNYTNCEPIIQISTVKI